MARSVTSATTAPAPARSASISITSPVMSVESTSMTTSRRSGRSGVWVALPAVATAPPPAGSTVRLGGWVAGSVVTGAG